MCLLVITNCCALDLLTALLCHLGFFFSFVLCDWFANIFSPWTLQKDTHCAVKLSLIRLCPRVCVCGGGEGWRLVVIDFPVSGCAFSERIQKVSFSKLDKPSRSNLSIT